MNAHDLMAGLSQRMGVTPPAPSDAWLLTFDGRSRLHVVRAGDRLHLMCDVGAVGNLHDADLMLRLSAISVPPVCVRVDAQTAGVVVWAVCEVDRENPGTFEVLVRRLRDAVEAVRAQLKEGRASPAARSPTASLLSLRSTGVFPSGAADITPARPGSRSTP